MRFTQEISVFNPYAINDAVISLGTSIRQTAEEIRLEATALYASKTELTSTFSQTATSFAFTLSKNGDKTASLEMSYTKGDGSVISLEAQSIEFSSLVTFSNLSTSGETTINGGNITANTISLDSINGNGGTLTIQSNRLKINSGTIGIGSADAANRWTIGGDSTRAWIYSGSKSSYGTSAAGTYIGTDGIEVKGATGNTGNVTRISTNGIFTTYIEMYDSGLQKSSFMYLDDRTDYEAGGNKYRMLFTKGIATGYSGVASADNWFLNKTHLEGGYDEGSDRRIKSDISRIDSEKAKAFIKALEPSQFHFTNRTDTTRWHHGFVAQDVEKVAWDGLVSGEGEEIKGISYTEIIADIVAVLQELLAEREG